jgi:hypothetical protein
MGSGSYTEGVGLSVKILDLISFIESRVTYTYYPNRFPVDSAYVPDEVSVVTLTGGFPINDVGTRRPSFQVRVRGGVNGDAACEAKAYEIHGSLTNLEEVVIGTAEVVAIRAMNSVPLYLGEDENQRPIYSMNFQTTVRNTNAT